MQWLTLSFMLSVWRYGQPNIYVIGGKGKGKVEQIALLVVEATAALVPTYKEKKP